MFEDITTIMISAVVVAIWWELKTIKIEYTRSKENDD